MPRRVRWFVAAILALLLIPGLVGFDAWPLTAWRLFSLARGGEQTHWEIDAVTDDGEVRIVDLDRLPMAYHLAEWPLAELPDAGEARRDDVCHALLNGVSEEMRGVVAVRIVRNQQRIVERDGEFVVLNDRQPVHACGQVGSQR